MQLLPSLLSELQAVCATFPDRRKGRGGNIAPTDFGLSAFAMFFMQSASFLAYQRTMEKGHGRSNCRTLFGIGRIPSDNYIRDFLDEADPALLQPCFERMEALLSEPPMRQAFGRLGGRTLIALDGTPSGAGSPSMARGWRRCAPCSSATICSPATPSPR